MVAIFPFYNLPFLAGFSLANFADEQVSYQFFGQSYAQACQKILAIINGVLMKNYKLIG